MLALLITCSPLAHAGDTYQGRPLPSAVGLPTHAQWLDQQLAWGKAHISEAFLRERAHGQPWVAAAAEYMDDWCRIFASAEEKKSFATLLAVGTRLVVDQKCDDPMVQYLYGASQQLNGRHAEALVTIKGAWTGMVDQKFPDIRLFSCAQRMFALHEVLDGEQLSPEAIELKRSIGRITARLLTDAQFDSPLGRRMCDTYLKDFLSEELPISQEAFQPILDTIAKGTVNPWLAGMAKGRICVSKAWISRGSGWANSVTPEGWKGFTEQLALARDAFTSAWNACPDFAEPAFCMITVCLGQESGGNEQRLWFDRALSVEMDCPKAFSNLMYGMQPRWGGSHDAILALGMEALKTHRFDTETPYVYIDAVTTIGDDLKDDPAAADAFWKNPMIWAGLNEAFTGIIGPASRYAYAAGKNWNRSRQAAFAWKTGHPDIARKLLDELGNAVYPSAFPKCAGVSLDVVRKDLLNSGADTF